MSTIHFKKTTTATPEQFIAGLTDFGPGRGKLFGNSTDDYLKVHEKGSTYADVTEGSSGIWERLHYDWSNPKRVVLTTTDSNLWGGRSGHTYTFTHRSTELRDQRSGKSLNEVSSLMPDRDVISIAQTKFVDMLGCMPLLK